jgi:glycine/D-amino acid oxidase-like deaminating enzyme
MSIIAGAAIGAAVGVAAALLPRKVLGKDENRPPHLHEFFADNFWFDSIDLYGMKFNPPLKGKEKADIVILGGGYAGLASALHLIQRYPNKRIVVLEGACCGYGASGRNGGHAMVGIHGLQAICKKEGPEQARKIWNLTLAGLDMIKDLVNTHGVDCDLEQNGKLMLALNEKQEQALGNFKTLYDQMGIESTMLNQTEVRKKLKSDRYIAGWTEPFAGQVNPAKLVRGMKDLVEKLGVEVYERSQILKITPGEKVIVKTEFGEIEAPQAVVTLNGYAPHLGLFKHRIITATTNIVATEPLSESQLESIGWAGREACADMRGLDFNYFIINAANRIVIGGETPPIFYDDGIHTGSYGPIADKNKKSLLLTFPQLEGIKFTHEWGGTMALTMDWWPAIGVTGEHKNMFYAGGWNGEGVVMCQLGGKIIGELVAGEESDFTKLPFVNRKFPYSGSEPYRFVSIKAYLAYLDKFGTNMII